ncbi:MAG: oligosaccharide flippase family protein [Burkholderiaceae bacterium]|nr:oligosaccharide flippase family protein [Burkholderiaceae bacterium]
MTREIQRQAAKGAAWMFAFKLVDRSLGLISTLILVRLLSPADFGVVAMAMAFIALAELLAGFGFDIALIHNQRATRAHYDTAWTFNVILGLSIALLLLLSAQPIAAFYQRPDLVWVVAALALAPAIGGFENIGVVAFRKELNFAREFAFLFGRRLASFLVVVPAAFWLRDYWALIAGSLAGRGVGVALSYYAHPFRPRPSVAQAADLLGFSKWMLANNVVIFLRERTTDFLVGRLHGARALGLFNVSNELSNLPLTELAAPANRALIPAFARLQDQRDAVRSAFSNAVGLLAVFAVAASAGIAAVAPWAVPVVLGPKWADAVELIQILAISGGIVTFQSPICALLIGLGYPQRVFVGHLTFVAILAGGLLALPLDLGVRAAAYAVLLAAAVSTPVFLGLLHATLRLPAATLPRALLRPLLAAIVMFAVIRLGMPPLPSQAPALTGLGLLLLCVVGGAAVYAAALAALWFVAGRPAGAERMILEQVRALGQRLRRR